MGVIVLPVPRRMLEAALADPLLHLPRPPSPLGIAGRLLQPVPRRTDKGRRRPRCPLQIACEYVPKGAKKASLRRPVRDGEDDLGEGAGVFG